MAEDKYYLDLNDPKEYHQAIYNNTVTNIEAALESGELTEEEADAFKLQAMNDLEVRMLVEDGYNEEEAVAYVYGEDVYEDEESESINYSSENMGNAEFNEENLNDFAIALAELIEDEYETLEDGILSLAEATGYEPDDVVKLLTGEGVPTEDLVDDIVTCFDSTMQDEDIYIALQLLAAEARGEDVDIEEDNEEYYYEEEEAEEYDPELEAAYSEVEQLRNKVAEFETSSILKTRLDQLVRKAEHLMSDFRLMPVEYQALFGSLPDALDNEKIAMFSKLCEKSNVSLETELYAMAKVLEVAERRGQLLPGGKIISEEFSNEQTEEAEFAAEVGEQAKRNLEMIKNSGHLNFN